MNPFLTPTLSQSGREESEDKLSRTCG
jgi:hypothetical protein